MADDIRQRIIASAFSKRSPSGSLEEQYIAHLKIYEDVTPGNDDSGRKARYVILSLSLKGPALLHKSRENTNGSFSIGKTWDLKELTALEVSGRTPGFDITFARRYRWQTDNWDDQEAFLIATVKQYRRIMGGQTPQISGWRMPEGAGVSMASRSSAATSAAGGEDGRSTRSATPPLPSGRERGQQRRLQVSTNSTSYSDTPPRSSSPNTLTTRQMASVRSASPTGRTNMLQAPTPGTSGLQQGTNSNGRIGLPNGVRGRSPSPGPSPRSAYAQAASPLERERAYPVRSPLAREESITAPPREPTPSSLREGQSSRSGRRPPDLERSSFERGRDRENGLPSNPRRAPSVARTDRTASPPPEFPSGRYPPSRSERAPSPQLPVESTPYRNGVTPSPRRPRGNSRSERAPSPNLQPDPIPQRRDRDRVPSPNPLSESSYGRTGAMSRPGRTPSPNPPSDVSSRKPKRIGRPERGPSAATPPPEPAQRRSRAGSRSDPEGQSDAPSLSRRRDAVPSVPKQEIPTRASPAPQRAQAEVADPRERPPLPVALNQGVRKDPYARISFYDPANQATADRLLAASDKQGGEEESNEATMANIEEMLEGYEWSSVGSMGIWGEPKGAADQIEARLLKELSALDAANMYSFVETDDRVTTVLGYIDEALKELDDMDGNVTSYKIHLNAVNDDISYIQSQNRGLQVQTQNQRALLKELEDLLQSTQVDRESLLMLTNQSLEKTEGLGKLEEAATELYKALQAGKDSDMAATMQRLGEYRTYNKQFSQRLLGFLTIMISYQAELISKGDPKKPKPDPLVVASHGPLEKHLGNYSGLIRYMREMDETQYGKLCGVYFGAASGLYKDQIKVLLEAYLGQVRRATDEESDMNFAPVSSSALSRGATMRRAGTIRSPMEGRAKDKDKDKDRKGDLRGYEVFGRILDQICPLTYKEEEFLSSFLQINEFGETFADYMNLDNYFRQQASRWGGLSRETQRLLSGAMDLIFSFLPDGLKKWIDDVLELDKLQMIGITAHLERYKSDAEERGNTFLAKLLQRQHQRVVGYHITPHLDELIKGIEAVKLSSKKRKGVVHFIKYFPVFVNRVEGQLAGADSFEIRTLVDTSYEKLVNAMFDSLQQMAKLEGEGEDKGQLNYHVILIENMYSFINDLSQQSLGSMSTFTRRAESIYDENLGAYVRLILRRPFQKLMDFVEGAEKMLKTLSPTDVSSNSSYNKAQLKKIIKDNTAKDVKRHVDTIFKRVEKHFSEDETSGGGGGGVAIPGTVLLVVWQSCEDEMIKLTERFLKFIATCHKESNSEFYVADVESAFKKHKA